MKITSDIINKDKSLFIKNKLKDICPKIFNENILLKFERGNIDILNTNYKKPALVNINFLDKKVNDRLRIRVRDNNDIFNKIFPDKGSEILDCTAGFGRDARTLDLLGYKVTMVEKSPLIILILRNALNISKNHNLKLYYGDSYDFLNHSEKEYDYIYIDFMFDKTKDKSLSSKNDEILKIISLSEENKNRLVKLAIKKSKKRVVVKEPKHSSSNIINADFNIKTKLINYNIYNGENK
tara:strand:+ start:171 stop:884 length:714 start_codon:yes stop_codon:yes gene_type:complete